MTTGVEPRIGVQPPQVLERITRIHPPALAALLHPGPIVVVPADLHQGLLQPVPLKQNALQSRQLDIARPQQRAAWPELRHRQAPRLQGSAETLLTTAAAPELRRINQSGEDTGSQLSAS